MFLLSVLSIALLIYGHYVSCCFYNISREGVLLDACEVSVMLA